MSNYNSNLQSKNIALQAILDKINNLPESDSEIVLPELTNEGSASDLLFGKQLIDGDGNVVIGTIPTKTSSDLTANGATVTVPSGYYASQATKSIATGSAKTPATTITKNPSISVNSSGLITASVSGTQSVTPTVTAGYVSSGTSGTITVSGSNTKQLTTQAAKTITPSTSSQTAVASGVYTTGAVTVAGDANLKAENIKSGVSIFGVTGTASGSEDLDTELTAQENLISQLSTILDSKASGGGSSGGGVSSPVCGYCEVTDNGMVEPGTNEYVFTSDNLQIANVTCLLLGWNFSDAFNIHTILYRKTLSDAFRSKPCNEGTDSMTLAVSKTHDFIIDDYTFCLYGSISSPYGIYYMAW